jgi:hypothetical protein
MTCAAKAMISAAGDARLTRRRVVNMAAHAREMKTAIFDIRILDLSPDGCRISSDSALAIGDEIWLQIPGIATRQARIAWAEGREAGCEFTSRLADALLSETAFSRRSTTVVKRAQGAFGSSARRG